MRAGNSRNTGTGHAKNDGEAASKAMASEPESRARNTARFAWEDCETTVNRESQNTSLARTTESSVRKPA